MTVYERQIDQSGQGNRWQDCGLDKRTTVQSDDEVVPVSWNVGGALQVSETVSSVAYEDNGSVTSTKAVSSPVITFLIQKAGFSKVTVTGSAGTVLERRWYLDAADGRGRDHDYNRW